MTIEFECAARNGKPQRLVIARFEDGGTFRDELNTDDFKARSRFWESIAVRAGLDCETLERDFAGKLHYCADDADASVQAELGERDDGEARQSTATQLITLARAAGLKVWRSLDGECFGTMSNGNHTEHHRTSAKAFRQWLSVLFYSQTGRAANSQAIADATSILDGEATFGGEQHSVWLRTASFEDRIYIDIGDETWRAIEIDSNGWRIVENPPVRFRRPKTMMPMPIPDASGDAQQIRNFINVDVQTRQLILAWLVAALRPTGPYPVVALHGEQGTGKSTVARLLRMLVDPNAALVRRMPNEPRDLASMATNSWVLAADNISHLPPWLSDALCVLSTGGAFAARSLFTDSDESVFTAQRPILATGITDYINRSDLLDRTLSITLEPIPESDRRQERLMMAEFELAKPRILGGLLNAVSCGLRRIDSVRLESLPRMADFLAWAEACGPSLGLCEGDFPAIYTEHRKSLNAMALESQTIAKTILDHMPLSGWTGTATDLLDWVSHHAPEEQRKMRDFPRNATVMGNQVRRVAPNLRAAGLDVQFDKIGGERRITFTRTGDQE